MRLSVSWAAIRNAMRLFIFFFKVLNILGLEAYLSETALKSTPI